MDAVEGKAPISFLFEELITCGAVLSTFELVEALRKIGREAYIVSPYRNQELEEYFKIVPVTEARGVTIAVSPKCQAEWAYVRTNDPRWLQHDSKKIAVSEYIKKGLDKKTRCVIVLGNGTHERFYNMGMVRDIDVLICGNDESNKNIEETIANARDIASIEDPRIVWFGRSTSGKHNIETITAPNIRDIPVIYNRAKVFLSMSKDEGWGRPVAEAQACGCEVINKNGGNRTIEIVSWGNIANQLSNIL